MKERKPMSEEGKAKIRAAAQKRWAEYRKTKYAPKERESSVAYMIRSSKGDRFLISNLSEQFISYLKDNGLEVWSVSLLQKR